MNIKETINQDLKSALLSGDKVLATTLRGLKSVILYAEVAKGNREEGLAEQAIVELFTKEAKKRQESADLYNQGGNAEKANAELEEKKVIERYLPQQLSEEELTTIVDSVERELGSITKEKMGQAIGKVKALAGAQAEGSRIAEAVKARIA